MTSLRHFAQLRCDAGFSLVETLVAVAIVGTAMAGLSGALVSMKQANDKSKTVYAALGIQSELNKQLAEENNFRDLATGARIEPNLVTSLPLHLHADPAPAVNVAQGAETLFTNDLAICTTFGGACTLSVTYRFSKDAATGIWRAAYRIRAAPSLDLQIANLGAPGTGTTFAASDYRTPLPDLVFKDKNFVGCTDSDDVALMGFDRNTGTPNCLKKSTTTTQCPTGTFAKKLVVVTVAGNPEVKLDCQAGAGQPSRTFSCQGAPYALQTITNPQYFDTALTYVPSEAPVCVWRARASESGLGSAHGPATTIQGLACPRPPGYTNAYTFSSVCTLAYAGMSSGGCMTIPSCSSSFVPFPANPAIVPTLAATYTDEVNCTANPGHTPPLPPPSCYAGSYDALYHGTVSFPGNRTCTLTGFAETKPAVTP